MHEGWVYAGGVHTGISVHLAPARHSPTGADQVNFLMSTLPWAALSTVLYDFKGLLGSGSSGGGIRTDDINGVCMETRDGSPRAYRASAREPAKPPALVVMGGANVCPLRSPSRGLGSKPPCQGP